MKQRVRVILKWAGYVAAYLFAFAIFFYLTFPYEQLKERIISGYNASQTGPSPDRMEIDSLSWSWRFPGIVAKGVRLIGASPAMASAPTGDEKPAANVMSIERVSARISPLLLIFGTKQVSFSADAFGGDIGGTASTSSDGQELEVELSDIAPGQIPLLGKALGLPIAGTLNGDLDLLLPEGKTSLARGEIDLKFEDLEIGDGKAKIRNTLALPTVQVGTLELKATATNGQVKIEQLKAAGADIEVEAEGKVRLRDKMQSSTAELEARFKFTDRYKSKNDVTKALFGDPATNTPGVFDLDPTIKRAKQEDGSYDWTVSGALERLQFNPSNRHAAGGAQRSASKLHSGFGAKLPVLKAKEVAPSPAAEPAPAPVEPAPAPAAEPRKDAGH
jgi:type II secretion system protein N